MPLIERHTSWVRATLRCACQDSEILSLWALVSNQLRVGKMAFWLFVVQILQIAHNKPSEEDKLLDLS